MSAGARPRPRWGAYSAPPALLAGFKGPTSKEREGRGEEGRGRMGQEGGEGKWTPEHSPSSKFATAPLGVKLRGVTPAPLVFPVTDAKKEDTVLNGKCAQCRWMKQSTPTT